MLSHLAGPHWFWALLAAAVVIWYSTITIYVAIRGAFDIKHMLDNLQKKHLKDSGRDTP